MSDALARPTFLPFLVEAEYVWVDCDLPGFYKDFKVEVRANLTNRERKRLNILIEEINADGERITENSTQAAKVLDARRADAEASGDIEALEQSSRDRATHIIQFAEAYDANRQRIHEAIAPYVRNWNAGQLDDDGNPVDALPPSVLGAAAFEVIDSQMLGWIVRTILVAYRGGKGLNDSSPTRDEPDAPPPASNGTTPNANPKTGRSAKSRKYAASSPSPSAST